MSIVARSEIKGERRPISHEILSALTELASRSEILAGEVESKLSVVMRPPGPECQKAVSCVDEYPPLFKDIQNHINAIHWALDGIKDSIDRTEL